MSKIYRAGLKIDSNAEEVSQEFEELANGVNKAANSAERLDAKFEDVYKDLEPLTTRMGEAEDRLYELALAGDTASQEYQDLLTKVGEYRKVQIQTDLAVDAAATTMTQKLGMGINAATSGFAAVQGAMGLVGVESEALEKTLLKVQSALAIQQGVQGIRESLPLFKSMGMAARSAFSAMTMGAKAFAVTGIGVVLTAVAALAYALNELEEQEKRAEEERQKRHDDEMARYDAQMNKQKRALTETNEALDEEQKAREHKVRLLQAEGKSIVDAEWEVANGYMETLKAKADAAAKEHNELGEKTKKMYADLADEYAHDWSDGAEKRYQAEKKLLDKKRELHNKRRAELKEEIKEYRKLHADGFDNMEILEAQHLQNRKEKYKKWRDWRLKAERLIEDLDMQTDEEGEERDVAMSNKRFDRMIEDLKKSEYTAKEKARLENLYLVKKFQEEDKIRERYRKEQLAKEIAAAEELARELAEIRQKQLEQEKADKERLAEVTKQYFDRESMERLGAYAVEVAQTNAKYDALVKLAEKYGQTTFHIEKERQAALAKLDKENNEKTKEEKAELHEAIIAGASATFETLGNLAQLFAGESEESQRKAFKVQKAANIAQATIDTYAAAVAAYKSLAGVPVVGPILGGAAAAAAVTAGLLNIKAISQQEFEGGNQPGGQEGNFSGGSGGTISPEFNIVGDAGIDQFSLLSQNQQPVQAYVVSGEVTSSQALDRNRVENATL